MCYFLDSFQISEDGLLEEEEEVDAEAALVLAPLEKEGICLEGAEDGDADTSGSDRAAAF